MNLRPIPDVSYKNILELELVWLETFGESISRRKFYHDVTNMLNLRKMQKGA